MDTARTEKIQRILAAAAAAPSGDNSQPWRFVVNKDSIEFHYSPERDHPILNYEESGTLIALGAALQNAEFEALAQGFTPHTTVCEAGSCVATMALQDGCQSDELSAELQKAISERHSNRKAYAKTPLSQDIKSSMLDPRISNSAGLKLSLIESQESMKTISRAVTTMEETALGNEHLHEFFFSEILWSEKENREGKQGLFISTLELPVAARAMFRLLKHWRIAKLLAMAGFPKKVAEINAGQNASASAFGVITVQQTSRATYLEIGKMLERIWLLATARQQSMQIITGITFLARSLHTPEIARLFTPVEQDRIRAAHAIIKRTVDETREPILIFRIGVGDTPTEVSYRRTPEVVFN